MIASLLTVLLTMACEENRVHLNWALLQSMPIEDAVREVQNLPDARLVGHGEQVPAGSVLAGTCNQRALPAARLGGPLFGLWEIDRTFVYTSQGTRERCYVVTP